MPTPEARIEESGYEAPVERFVLPVRGMSCASCVSRVEKALTSVPGVISAEVNLASERAQVALVPGQVTLGDLRRAVAAQGYEIPEAQAEVAPDRERAEREREMRRLKMRFFIGMLLSPPVVALSLLMIACFGVAALYFFLSTTPSQPVRAGVPSQVGLELVDVLVPIARIEAGTALESTMFRKESRPALAVGAKLVKDFDQLKGTYAASFVAAGQPLLQQYVTARRPINQIQATIPDGYRGVTMAVDTTTSVEGWARPGAKVDVVLASTVNGRLTATVIVQNAKVLSAGRGSEWKQQDGHTAPPSTVTIMVTIEEAAKIQLASNSGALSLSLRGDEDTIESPTNSTITIDSILGGDMNQQPAVIPSEGRVRIDGRTFSIVNGQLIPQP